MTDRELLELAAKAGGYRYDEFQMCWYEGSEMREPAWNPLTDDGDALRLAVKLKMGISIPVFNKHRADVISFRHTLANAIEEGNDPYAATRRTIVRVAAEIALLQYEIKKLRAERSALRAELPEICTTLDDAACDLTLTTVECIKKLKADNESLKLDAARLDWVEHQDFYDLSFAVLVDQPNDGMIAVSIGEGWHLGNNLREAIDAAMTQGEQK